MNVVDWTINNFGCWNVLVHEKQIECSGSYFLFCPRILLYPKGLSGSEEYIVVQIYGSPEMSSGLSGHFSCIGSSGSPICTQEISENEKKGDFYELLPNLKFTEVAAEIRKNEIIHQDRFTLRCELRCNGDRAYRFYTTIDVFDSSLQINPIKIKEAGSYFSKIHYSLDDFEKDIMSLHVARENSIFFMEPTFFKKRISVSISLSVLKFDSVSRTEENEHVFQNGERWRFLNSLTSEEVTEEGFSLLLRIKIAPNNKYKHYYGYYTWYSNAVDLIPTHILNLSKVTSNKTDNSVTVLLNELMCLYQDHNFSDFQLRCGEVSIPTHKSILSARSPVFKAMLHSDMKETASDTMHIPDLDVHTLGRFLVFLYTGTVNDLQWEGALKLYYAADKYQVSTLKRECCSVFHKNVSISNVCDILSLADKHYDEELTTEARDFILKNYRDVLRSEGWQTFMNNEPLLASKTLTYFGQKNTFKVIPDS